MRIQVLYFAVLRERLRVEKESLELPDGATIDGALAAIAARHPSIAPLLPQVQAAANRSMVPGSHVLSDGDEVALIPPVAGGAARRIAVLATPLAMAEVVNAVEGPERGGLVTFAGVVRNHGHHGGQVVRLEYEAYVEMAEQVLREIADEIERELPEARVAIHHRVGSLGVGETAVVIAAAAPHRPEAFEACRAAIDRLKKRAPIWKKEIGVNGEEWIGLCP